MRGMLIDVTRCFGCQACTVACKMANGVPIGSFKTFVYKYESGTYPNVRRDYVKHACMHCKEPVCVSACPVGALYKDKDGIVRYNSEKCIGCRYCMYVCPFGVPTFEWHKNQLEKPIILKCDFCANRIDGGKGFACAEACPVGAIMQGEFKELLKEAQSRIKNRPDRYISYIYGEKEGGGTSIIYISHRPFREIGLPNIGTEPLTSPSEKSMLQMLPAVSVLALVLAGIRWISHYIEESNKEKEG